MTSEKDQTPEERALIREFIDAAVEDQPQAERLLAEHPELREATWLGSESVLHFLAIEGFVEGVRFLGHHGFDVNALNGDGDSALLDAVV